MRVLATFFLPVRKAGLCLEVTADKTHQTVKADSTVIFTVLEKTIFCVVMRILGVVEMVNVW